jgi:hypothetical protein
VKEESVSIIVMATLAVCSALQSTDAIGPERPVGQRGEFELVKDWTFGRDRAGATVTTRAALDRDF